MPDIYETDTTRTWARDTAQAPHVSDAPQISPAMPGEGGVAALRNRLSWPAILAGVVVALVTQLLLNLIGMALGAASLAPLSGGASPATFSTGAGIWFGLSSILAALAGGYAAGRFSGAHTESNAGWHGLTTWALSTLLLSYLLSTAAAGILGGLGGAAKTASQVAAPGFAAMADPFSSIEQELRSTTASNDPTAMRDAAIASVRAAVTGEGLHAAETTERAAQALARAENISVENARTLVQGYEQQYRQSVDLARQQATRTADDAAKAVSRAALLGAISLILGGLAGWLGGRMAMGDESFTDRLATASGRARR
jgi:hypothetical protein